MVYVKLNYYADSFYWTEFEFVFKNFPEKKELVYALQNGKFFPFSDSHTQKIRLYEAEKLAEVIKNTTLLGINLPTRGLVYFEEQNFSFEFKEIEFGY